MHLYHLQGVLSFYLAKVTRIIKPLNPELNPICYLLASFISTVFTKVRAWT